MCIANMRTLVCVSEVSVRHAVLACKSDMHLRYEYGICISDVHIGHATLIGNAYPTCITDMHSQFALAPLGAVWTTKYDRLCVVQDCNKEYRSTLSTHDLMDAYKQVQKTCIYIHMKKEFQPRPSKD